MSDERTETTVRTDSDAAAAPARPSPVAAVLSLTALGLLIAIAFQAMTPWTPQARGEMAMKADAFSAMTTDGGSEEFAWVIDDRNQILFLYRAASNNRGVEFVDRQSLPDLFAAARRQAGG